MKTIVKHLDDHREVELNSNFIAHYKNAFTHEQCDEFIDFLYQCVDHGQGQFRHEYDTSNQLKKSDQSTGTHPLLPKTITAHYAAMNRDAVEYILRDLLPVYCDHYFTELNDVGLDIYEPIKVQKTEPGGGYHEWHCETLGKLTRDRVFAYMIYLNDVDEGGETEFLYQTCRYRPRKGDFLIWPGYFTHVHRGNPPLSNDKYIATGWIEYK